MRRRLDPRLLLVAALLFGPAQGCAGPFEAGVRAYDDARYPQALEELAREEPRRPIFSECNRTRYDLYRGLAHLALGDRARALAWLERTEAAVRRDPTLLDTSDTGRLEAARAHLVPGLVAPEAEGPPGADERRSERPTRAAIRAAGAGRRPAW